MVLAWQGYSPPILADLFVQISMALLQGVNGLLFVQQHSGKVHKLPGLECAVRLDIAEGGFI